MIAFRIEGNDRYSQAKISRSIFRSRTRDGALRLRTITCWRRIMFSASSLARDFSRDRATSRSLIRNANIAAPLAQLSHAVTPDEVFGSDIGQY